MDKNQSLTSLTEELAQCQEKLQQSLTARNNLEAAFKRLLFAVDQQMEVLSPIILSFKGKDGKKMGIGALPTIINKVMAMLDEEKIKVLLESTEQDIIPMTTQYVPYYKAKEEALTTE